MGWVIVLSSGFHGSGRSRISYELRKLLKRKYSVGKISSGEIFREIAKERGFSSIEDFISEITRNLDLGVDVEVDKKMMERIRELSKSLDFLIVDSNLAPYYLRDALRLIVFASPRVAARRVFEDSRIMDRKYSSIEDVLESLKRRTEEDIERYRML